MQLRKITVVALALLTMSESGSAQAQRRAPSPTDTRLYARLLAMTDARTFNKALVDSSLASTWQPLRAAGALAVGQVGAGHAIGGGPMLRSLLSDANFTVAANAAYALGLLRDSSSIPALSAALNANPRVAREAAWSLGEIGAPARAAILSALARPALDDARSIQLLLAAAKLRPVPVKELRPYLAMNTRPHIQWAAAYAIARFRAPAGVRDLVTLGTNAQFLAPSTANAAVGTNTAVPTVIPTAEAYVIPQVGRQRARAEIARGLAKTAAGDSLGDMAVNVLLGLVGDAHPHVRINAVRSLATYGLKARSSLVGATRDRDANVRIATAQAIGTVLDSVTSAWLPLWQNDTSLMYRSSLLASAMRAGARVPALSDWITHRDWRYRAAALAAFGASTDTPAVASVAKSMIRDPDGRVRASAYGLLVGNDTAALPVAIHDALLGGLTDADFYARAAVIGNLAAHARARDVPAVLSTYTRSLADSGNDARVAAIQFIAAAWKKDSAAFTPALRDEIKALKPSDDPLVRAAVDSTSIFASWPSTSGNPRPLSWYQNIVATYVVPALQGRTQRATIRTRHGDVILELFGADAPITVWNFMNLARTGYYNGTGFHRVVPNFVAQDGDPRDDGSGGPGYAIRDEMNPRRYERGALGMALSGPDTGGSQYFLTHSPQPHLDGHYTVFGRVLRGFSALDAIVQGDRILSITVQ